jgi:RHS repeat-associated protein
MTHKQRAIRYRWFRRLGWVGIIALGFQTAAPAAEAGVRVATRHYRAWQYARQQALKKLPDVRVLRKAEMQHLKGRGRIPSLAGQAKWDIIDNGVNLRTRNYTYTATDLTLPGAIGIPVSVVRTWNANDDREGPFGIGWSWSLDVRQAAGGLIKRKASPSRTVPTQVNNGRNMNIAKIEATSGGPVVQVIQVDGAQCQDAGGEQWIVWRDADGLYTPPPWDHNEYESTYQSVLIGSGENQYLRDYAVTTKVTTPDGTVYYYEAVMQERDLPVALDNQGNEVYAEQVLKWVEDRHGNRTEYEYVYIDNVYHSYYRSDGSRGTAVVRKAFVKTIRNAIGFVLTVDWNFESGGGYDQQGVLQYPRVVAVHSSDGRTVRYWYGPEGQEQNGPQNWAGSVTAVESYTGVLVAKYGYGNWSVNTNYCEWLRDSGISCSEHWLLTKITDADGATTEISYNSGVSTNQDRLFYAVAVSQIQLSSKAVFVYQGDLTGCVVLAHYNGLGSPCVARSIYIDDRQNDSYGNRLMIVREEALLLGTPHGGGTLRRERTYNFFWQQLIKEVSFKPGWTNAAINRAVCGQDDPDELVLHLPEFAKKALCADVRALPIDWMADVCDCGGGPIGVGDLAFMQTIYPIYNCLGQPLRIDTIAQSWNQNSWGPFEDLYHTRIITYHGKEFYYQKATEQETVRGQTRTIRYQYFSRNDPRPGYKGQLWQVYADHAATNGLPLSEVVEYNNFGQPVLTRALQRADGSPRWVYTKTEYDPLFHQPSKVIEDYRYPNDPIARQQGINRIQITQYDGWGRPQYQATYAPSPNNPEQPGNLIRQLETIYDPLTEQVQEIWRTDQSRRRLQKLASYTYTQGGRLLTATDHLSNITNEIDYYPHTWQVSQTREWWGNLLRYRMDYFYAIDGSGGDLRRKILTVFPNDPQRMQQYQWDYGFYLTSVVFPLQRVFTRVVMRSLTHPMEHPLVVDYLYDPQTMRLRATRFAAQPITNSNDPDYNTGKAEALGIGADPDNLGIPLYQQTPQSFAFAWYAYDGAGRLTELRYYSAYLRSQRSSGERYDIVSMGGFSYLDSQGTPLYDEAGNRLGMSAYDELGRLARTERYQYDALDRLTRVSYNNGAWQSWAYDVMGNRYGAGNPAYDGLNRLTRFNGAAIQHDLLGNRLQDGRYLYQWDALNRLVGMQAYQASGRFKVVGDAWRFVYRADGLRVVREKVSLAAVADGGGEGGGSSRTEYLYDGQMPVCEQEFAGSTLRTTRVNFLGARGIEAVVTVDHTRGNAVALRWLLYDGHGNLVRTMAPDYTLSAFQWRGVWGEVQGSLGAGRGYCANLGHPEDETGLVYMRARYYEPATGRFISEDPARDGVNWYLYADGNPVNKVDYEGKESEWERKWNAFLTVLIIVAGALLGAGISMAVAGAAMIKAAEAAYKSPDAQGAKVLLVQGRVLLKAGVYSIVAGAALTFVVWFGYGMTEEEFQEWKDTIGAMLKFAGEMIYRGWHPETWGS